MPPVERRMPFFHFQISTPTIPPASAPAMLWEGVISALRRLLLEPNSHAPVTAPIASARK